jgi:hypothetical protein
MRISAFCTAVLAYVVIGHAPPAAAQVDQQRAQEYFKEARRSASATVGGWTFRAAAGRVVREGARRGDYEAVRQQP